MYAVTKLLVANFKPNRMIKFFKEYLLVAVRSDIKKHKRLNHHYYFSLSKGFYKPSAWFKGILFEFCRIKETTLKEAQIISSVLNKFSIPMVHASCALLRLF